MGSANGSLTNAAPRHFLDLTELPTSELRAMLSAAGAMKAKIKSGDGADKPLAGALASATTMGLTRPTPFTAAEARLFTGAASAVSPRAGSDQTVTGAGGDQVRAHGARALRRQRRPR